MARRVRSSPLEHRSSRLKLPVAKKPVWVKLAEGLSLGYRRNAGPGSWSMRVADGKGGNWVKAIGFADDFEGTRDTFDYWAAQDRARKLHRGSAADDGTKLQTVAEALKSYKADLEGREGGVAVVTQIENQHLPATLASKLVAQLNARELRAWRDGLTAKGLAAGSATRYCKVLGAALRHAAAMDQRVTNTNAFKVGLVSLPGSVNARNVILPDATVRAVVSAAYAISPSLGLYVEVLATCGCRPIQARRLTCGDLGRDRLSMPSGKKGGKGKRTIRHRPLPIAADLAARLKAAAKGRPHDAPLLVKDDGTPWEIWALREPFREVAECVGLDPDEATPYCLRHSSITRQLRQNVPVRIVADAHDTSVGEIERHYSKYISHHADDLLRAALIDLDTPATGNVVSLR